MNMQLVRHLPALGESLALAGLGLMASLPFLHPHHRNPISTFFPEWWAVLFGVLAIAVLALPRPHGPEDRLVLPRALWLPGLLAALILVQLALPSDALADVSLPAALCLLWAIGVMAATGALAERHGRQRLAIVFATPLLLAALASVAIMALQAGRVHESTGWISTPTTGRLFANLNQPNHVALQLWLGVASALYLARRNRLRRPLVLAAVAILVIASLFTGSRATWAYGLALPILCLVWDRKLPSGPRCAPLGFVAFLLLLAGQALLAQFPDLNSTGQREWGVRGSDGIRAGLWWTAAQLGFQSPFLGIGWGRFASASFEHLPTLQAQAPGTVSIVPGEHAHNIGLNLFAELGLPGLLILVVAVAGWLWRVARHVWNEESALGVALLVPIALHAQLEYTLWYAFFLGIAAVALALSDPGRIELPRPNPRLAGLVLAGALGMLAVLYGDYTRLERAMYWNQKDADTSVRRWEEARDALVALRSRSRFGAYVDLALAGAMKPDREDLPHKLAICDKAIRFSPTDYAVFKCAALLALAGRQEDALARLERSLWAFPDRIPEFVAAAERLAGPHPELAPLVAAARRHAAERGIKTVGPESIPDVRREPSGSVPGRDPPRRGAT